MKHMEGTVTYEPVAECAGHDGLGTNSVFQTYVLLINFVFGAGVLGIPYAFSHGGAPRRVDCAQLEL